MGEIKDITFQQILFKSLCTLRVIPNISIETNTGNQTAFVFQGLVFYTDLLLWTTVGERLKNVIYFIGLVWFPPDCCPGQSVESMEYNCTPP